MIIDAHTHLSLPGREKIKPEDLIASMDEAGIDCSLVFANRSNQTGIDTDKVIEICQNYPRLKAIGSVEYKNHTQQSTDKLKKYLGGGKIYGVKFYLGYESYDILDPKLLPVYEYCEKMEKPVLFHTGALLTGVSGTLKHSHPLNVDEVATKYPNLKVVICHIGNPWIVDTAAIVAKNPNVYTDISGYFTEFAPIAAQEVEEFHKSLQIYKNFVGDFKKCIFGTDYPIYNQKEYLNAVQSVDMSNDEKKLVFSQNAKLVFNL